MKRKENAEDLKVLLDFIFVLIIIFPSVLITSLVFQ